MSDILFIRHAETGMAGAFCGRSDPPVNAAGHAQIEKLTDGLRNEPIAAIFTSDLRRATTTAQGLAETFGLPCIARPALREIDFGKWDGLAWEQIEKLDAPFAAKWLEAFPRLTPPGGEPFDEFNARVMAETSFLLSQSVSRLIAVVTHAGVMRAVLCTLCGLDEKDAWSLTKTYCCAFRYAPLVHPERRLQEVLG